MLRMMSAAVLLLAVLVLFRWENNGVYPISEWKVQALHGSVDADRSGAVRALFAGSRLTVDDVIETHAQSSIMLGALAMRESLVIGENSMVPVGDLPRELRKHDAPLFFLNGDHFIIEKPRALMGVRGGGSDTN